MNATMTTTLPAGMNRFNTGRKYTANGQVIFWEQQPDGTIWMNDVSRSVDYPLMAPPNGQAATDRYVLAAYDDRARHLEYGSYPFASYHKWVNATRVLPRS